jgi:hypothetical protein
VPNRSLEQNKLFMGKKFKFSAQGSDLAPFVGNGIKVKIPSEIKPPLKIDLNYLPTHQSFSELQI